MNISQYLDPEHPYFFYLLGAIILLVYIIISRRNIKKLNHENLDHAEDLNQDGNIPRGIEHFTSLDKVMRWKVVLLIVLIIIGLYLVFIKGPS